MAITIKDVARRAGVSPTTVSRAMNNRGYISAQTQQRISQAMEELNYSPNQLARSLFHAKTHAIGYVVPSIAHPFFAEITQLVEQKLYDAGYHLLLCTTFGSNDRERDIFDMLRQHRVEAIISSSHLLSDREYARACVPVVGLDTLIETAECTVAADHVAGGRMAARRLIQSGCRCALQIIGNPDAQTGAKLRHQSFFQEMTGAGIPCISVPIQKESDLDISTYRAAVESVFAMYPDADGYFATDLFAMEIVRCAMQKGKRIPEDVQIIGYDGTSVASASYPTITMIRQPFDALARHTVDSVCALVAGKPVERVVCLDQLEWVEGMTTRALVL